MTRSSTWRISRCRTPPSDEPPSPPAAPAMTAGVPPAEHGGDLLRAARLAKLAGLKALGVAPYPYAYSRTDTAAALETRYAALAAGVATGEQVRVAGRIRAIRNSG